MKLKRIQGNRVLIIEKDSLISKRRQFDSFKDGGRRIFESASVWGRKKLTTYATELTAI